MSNSITPVGNGSHTTQLTTPQLDAASLNLLREAGSTIPDAAARPPVIWWSHQPAGWCINIDESVIVDQSRWKQVAVRDRKVWFAEEIVVVVFGMQTFWFTFDQDGRRIKRRQYTEGARKAVQYGAMVAGVEPNEGHFVVVSTSRVTKSKALLADIRAKQTEINTVIGAPTPLWSIWMRLGALKQDGRVVYETTKQGAMVAPPRVLAAGWTKPENWTVYKAIQSDVAAWSASVHDDTVVVTGEVIDDVVSDAAPF